MIPVTKPHLPSKTVYLKHLDDIYSSGWLTNQGPKYHELSQKLAEILKTDNILLVANGTIALQIAFRVLEITGNAITSPFSFVATCSALQWLDIQPIFVDIDPNSFNIDVVKVRERVNSNTSAIVPVHIFGNPAQVEQIATLAEQCQVKIIYDAAHAFGTELNNSSILGYGDASILSFHATKLFHTVEGGAIVFRNKVNIEKARQLMNFGFDNNGVVQAVGINGKLSELHAAMGLAVLEEIDSIYSAYKRVCERYDSLLNNRLKKQQLHQDSIIHRAYYPVVFEHCEQRAAIELLLNEADIYPRRYFSPCLDQLKIFNPRGQAACPQAQYIADRILCLPLFTTLELSVVDYICEMINSVLN